MERFCCIMEYVIAKKNKKATCVQGSCTIHIIKCTLKHLSLSFCYHVTHYTIIAAYKYEQNLLRN